MIGRFFCEDHSNVLIGRRHGVLDIVDARFNCPFQAVTAVGMSWRRTSPGDALRPPRP